MKRFPAVLSALLILARSGVYSQVPAERIAAAAAEPGSWLTYSGSYSAQRFSALKEITPANVAGLKPVWIYQVKEPGVVETSPLVVDGVMYVTEPPSTVTALDLHSGRPLWSWSPTLPPVVRAIGFGKVNRGVAILGDTVYVGTLDAHLVALDAKTGAVRWDVVVGDNAARLRDHLGARWPSTGKIVIGVSGGEAGIRGFLDAYDARTGERRLALLRPSPVPANRATKPGVAKAGRPAAVPPG